MTSPYQDALAWMQQHPGTGGARTLAKLVLSLWNSDCAFSFRECISGLDERRQEIAVRMAVHFAKHGEDEELVEVGHIVCKMYPRLWELGQAADAAKSELGRKWADEDLRADA